MAPKVANRIKPLLIFRNNRFYEINNFDEKNSFSDLLRNRLDITPEEQNIKKGGFAFFEFPNLSELSDFVNASGKSKSLVSEFYLRMNYKEEMMKRDYRSRYSKKVMRVLYNLDEGKKLTPTSKNRLASEQFFKREKLNLTI